MIMKKLFVSAFVALSMFAFVACESNPAIKATQKFLDEPTLENFTAIQDMEDALELMNEPEMKVKAAFELRLSCIAGFQPELTGCAGCGNQWPDRFDIKAGMRNAETGNIDELGDLIGGYIKEHGNINGSKGIVMVTIKEGAVYPASILIKELKHTTIADMFADFDDELPF